MGFSLSPQVRIKEYDLSTIVPAVATSIAATAGEFQWGPCFDRKLITSEKDLMNVFGGPNNTVALHWWSAANFLAYSDTLYIVRAVDAATALNSGLTFLDSEAGDTTPVENTIYLPNDDASAAYTAAFAANEKIHICAKYPGVYGDGLYVAISNSTNFAAKTVKAWSNADGDIEFEDIFEYPPETDQLCIIVFSATGQVLEKFLVSLTPTAKDYEGNSIYIENYINTRSKYILAYNDEGNTVDIASKVATALSGGANGTPDTGDIQVAYDFFVNDEEIDVNLILDGGNANTAVVQQYIIDNIAEVRKDCVAVLTVPKSAVVGVTDPGTAATNCAEFKTTTLARASSYAAIYGNWKYQYDKYNDVYRWLPLSGDAAGIYARTDFERDPWFAPAGLNRGQIKNVVKLAFNPNRAQRDTLYKNQVNPIVSFASDGPVIFGQKTLQSKPSAFDRIDVRRLFIVLEKAISTASKYFLFEKNTAFTRAQLRGMIEPFLRRVKGREGIYEFLVVCDETNNTPAVIDANELTCDIFIQPTRTAEFINLNFIATRTGVDFNEFIGKQF